MLDTSQNTHTFPAPVLEWAELEEGFAFRFDVARIAELARYVAAERRASPFLRFRLSAGADNTSVWLNVSGEPGTKEFLRAQLSDVAFR